MWKFRYILRLRVALQFPRRNTGLVIISPPELQNSVSQAKILTSYTGVMAKDRSWAIGGFCKQPLRNLDPSFQSKKPAFVSRTTYSI